jgi:LysM repeat protein
MTRKVFQLAVVVAVLVASFASAGGVSAWSGCARYITVQWGDTLSGIAAQCGTTIEAIRAENPGLGWWVYAGQVLCIPTGSASAPVSQPGYGSTYLVQRGDTLGKIAARAGVSLKSILAVNPQIWDPSLIYAGQTINLPAGMTVSPPPYKPPQPTYPDYPTPSTNSLSILKVAYKYGLYIRSQPGGAIIASALDKDTLYYRSNSVFMDGNWKVWVEVRVYPPTKGYYTGWVLVKDQLGNYFTEPQIDK